MVDYESGTPAWDIGQILTRHEIGTGGDALAGALKIVRAEVPLPEEVATVVGEALAWYREPCAKVRALRSTAGSSDERVAAAHAVECNCGMGDSESEHTASRQKPTAVAS